MVDYTVAITRGWEEVGTGDAHLEFTGRVDYVGEGYLSAAWPAEHSDAGALFDAVADGDDPSLWGFVLRQTGDPTGPAFGWWPTLVGFADGDPGRGSSLLQPDAISVQGYADDGILLGATGYPDPSVDSTTAAVGGWSVYADGPWANAEDAILDVIRDNLGQTALPRRRLDALTVPASLDRGPAVNLRRRFPTLLEWAHTVCALSGLVVRVVRVGPGLQVQVREEQLREDVIWSRRERTATGVGVVFGHRPSSVLVGGKRTDTDDELTRQFLRVNGTPWAGDPGVPWEPFRDDTSADGALELSQSGKEALTDASPLPSVVIAPRTDLTDAAAFLPGRDYEPGDLVPIDVSRAGTGRPLTARVESVTFQHKTKAAWAVTPGIGQPLGNPRAYIRRTLRDLGRRGRA